MVDKKDNKETSKVVKTSYTVEDLVKKFNSGPSKPKNKK